MNPTILEGDRIFVNKLAYDLKVPFTRFRLAEWAAPKRGDVVVCLSPCDKTRLVKRVIGLPGDTVELRRNQLIVNGKPINYEPLDTAVIVEMSSTGRHSHVYATEQLGPRPHGVMWTPQLHGRRDVPPLAVPDSEYFVMGDNRDNSLDSRVFGFIPKKDILGKASFIVLSLDRENGWNPRWARFFSRMDH